MCRRIQKVKVFISGFVMAAILGGIVPAQNMTVNAQEKEPTMHKGVKTATEMAVSADTEKESAGSTETAQEGAETTWEDAGSAETAPEDTENLESALSVGEILQSEDQRWYYVERSRFGDEGEGVMITGRHHTGTEEADGIVSTYIEDGVEKRCYTIPNQIDGQPVTALGHWYYSSTEENGCGFRDLEDYDLVVVPEGVDKIDIHCFEKGMFKKIQLPDTLKEIGDYAFYDAANLTEVNIPTAVETFGHDAFASTPWLTQKCEENDQKLAIVNGNILLDGSMASGDISIPGNVREIADNAFNGNMNITAVIIPSSVAEIGRRAFCDCDRMTSIDIGNWVEKIGDEAFSGDVCLQTLRLPMFVRELGDAICRGCKKLETAEISATVDELPTDTFSGCLSLQTVKLPRELKSLGDSCFASCESLKEIDLPDSLQSLGQCSFGGCKGLETLTLPAGLQYVGELCFRECSSLTKLTLPKDLKYLGENAFKVKGEDTRHDITITVPEQMTDISHLNIAQHSYAVFRVVEGGPAEAYLKDNQIYPYWAYPVGCEKIDTASHIVSVPQTEEGDDSSQTEQETGEDGDGTNGSVTDIHNSVTIIDQSTTTNINVDHSTTNIDQSTTNVDQSTTNIDQSTTNVDQSTTNVDQSVTNIDQSAANIDQSTTTIINNPGQETAPAEGEKDAAKGLAGKVFTYKKCKYQINADEKTVTFVCTDNKNLKTLTIPGKAVYQKKSFKIVSVADSACKGMKKLKTVMIGANVESVGQKAFYNCTKLKTVTIGKKVEEIGKMAFYGDSALKKLTFQKLKTLKSVDTAAFYLKGKNTDKHLKNKSKSKKQLISYLQKSGVKVKVK